MTKAGTYTPLDTGTTRSNHITECPSSTCGSGSREEKALWRVQSESTVSHTFLFPKAIHVTSTEETSTAIINFSSGCLYFQRAGKIQYLNTKRSSNRCQHPRTPRWTPVINGISPMPGRRTRRRSKSKINSPYISQLNWSEKKVYGGRKKNSKGKRSFIHSFIYQ